MQSDVPPALQTHFINQVVNVNGFTPSISTSNSISAVTVVSAAEKDLYDKAFMATKAHDVPLMSLVGQSLLQ